MAVTQKRLLSFLRCSVSYTISETHIYSLQGDGVLNAHMWLQKVILPDGNVVIVPAEELTIVFLLSSLTERNT